MTCYWGHGMRWNERDLPQSWRLSVSTENCEGASLRKKQGECEDTQYIFNVLWTSEQGEHDSIITNNSQTMLPIHDLHPAIHTIYHHLFHVRNSQNPAESSRIIPCTSEYILIPSNSYSKILFSNFWTSPRSRLVPSNRHRGIAPWSPRSPPRTARRRRRRRHRGRCLRCRAAAGSAAANSPPRRPGNLKKFWNFPKNRGKGILHVA